MLYQDKSQLDFIPLETVVYYDWKTYAGFGVDVSGTISEGDLVIQGSSDGADWTTLFTVTNGAQVTNNQIVAPGHYACNTSGYQQGRILSENSFAGSVKLFANITVLPPPEVASVLGG